MGYTSFSSSKTKQDVINSITEHKWNDYCELEKSTLRGNSLWCLVRYNEKSEYHGDYFIALYQLSCYQGQWGYKGMTESEGPYYYTCPLAYIKTVEKNKAEPCEFAHAWRQKVKQIHEHKKSQKKMVSGLKPGDKIEYSNTVYTLKVDFGKSGWHVTCDSENSKLYRMDCRKVNASKLVSAA